VHFLQVQFAYFGESAAAGTVVTELIATDASTRPCVLSGYPRVLFFSGNVANGRAITARISYTAFSRDPGRSFSTLTPREPLVLRTPRS